MPTKLNIAAQIDGELEQLQKLFTSMSEFATKREYARWLCEQGDARGDFLNEVIDAWESDAERLPENDQFSKVWQRVSGVTLLQKIRDCMVDEFATALLNHARPAIMLNPLEESEAVSLGQSKFGGLPHLPRSFEWPEHDGQLLQFVCQINFEELQATQAASELPASGLLSVFLFDDVDSGCPTANWKVVLSAASETLQVSEPPREPDAGNPIRKELALEFEETIDLPYTSLYSLDASYADRMVGCRTAKRLGLTNAQSDEYEEIQDALMPDREERSHLLGWSHPQVAGDDLVDEENRHLLTLASEEACDWCWSDGHQLYLSLPNADFVKHEFSNVEIVDG